MPASTPREQLLRLWWILHRWFTASIVLRDVFVPILELVRVGKYLGIRPLLGLVPNRHHLDGPSIRELHPVGNHSLGWTGRLLPLAFNLGCVTIAWFSGGDLSCWGIDYVGYARWTSSTIETFIDILG